MFKSKVNTWVRFYRVSFQCIGLGFDSHVFRTGELLRLRLSGPNAKLAPYIHDIRGGGLFWGVEFSWETLEAGAIDLKGGSFAMLVQARTLKNGVVIMAFTGGANKEGSKGDHIILAPAYNVRREEIEMIVDILIQSVEEILTEAKSA